jgi:hypothetical protein
LPHREVPVKVTAWVDEGVAPLVVALNDFERVLTVDSCEGGTTDGAYVLFRVRGHAGQAAKFAAGLAEAMGERAPYLLQAEWRTGESEPLLALSCPRDSVPALVDALSAARTRLSVDGRSGSRLSPIPPSSPPSRF